MRTLIASLIGVFFAAVAYGQALTHAPGGATPTPPITGNKIHHVVILFQENRSFDEYFGAYSDPADNGIQTQAGTSTNGNTTLVVTDSSQVKSGWYVGGPGINAAGITISSITDATHIVLSGAPGSGSGSGTFMFQPVNGLTQAFSQSPCTAGPMLSAGIPNATANIGVPINGTSTPCYNLFANRSDINALGDHDGQAAQNDLDNGVTTAKNDGFVNNQALGNSNYCGQPQLTQDGIICLIQDGGTSGNVSGVIDSMQYDLREDLPNYWTYADQYVLLDNFYSSQRDWSLPAHLDLIAEWPAEGALTTTSDGTSIFYDSTCRYSVVSGCRTINGRSNGAGQWPTTPPTQAAVPYANLFQLFDQNADAFGNSTVSYKWYLGFIQGTNTAACVDANQTCPPQLPAAQGATASPPPHWNVRTSCKSAVCPPAGLNGVNIFNWVQQQITASGAYATNHFPNHGVNQFLLDTASGSCALPDVSWLIPAYTYSEHPPAPKFTGMEYTTALVNAVEQSPCADSGVPYWKDTVILIIYDDWGGAYDHVTPPNVYACLNNSGVKDAQCAATYAGWGIRVPAIMISPFVTANSVYHGALSFDQIATFIEDNIFNVVERLDPSQSNLLNVSAGGTGGTFAPTSIDKRPVIFDGIKGNTISPCCGLASMVVGDLGAAGGLSTNLSNGTFQAQPTPLSTHIPTGLYINCGTAGAQYATNTTYNCSAATSPVLVWQSPKQSLYCAGNTACVPNPSVAITYKVYRSTDGGAWSCIAGAAGCTSTAAITDPTATYTDSTIASGHTYDWRVAAIFAGQSETPMGPAIRGVIP